MRSVLLMCGIAMLSGFSATMLAGGLSEPVTVSRVGPEGGPVDSVVVDPQDSNIVYATSRVGVFKSSDAGATWSYSGLMGFFDVKISVFPGTIYATAPGHLFKSFDGGATWNPVLGVPPNLVVIAIDPHNQWRAGGSQPDSSGVDSSRE